MQSASQGGASVDVRTAIRPSPESPADLVNREAQPAVLRTAGPGLKLPAEFAIVGEEAGDVLKHALGDHAPADLAQLVDLVDLEGGSTRDSARNDELIGANHQTANMLGADQGEAGRAVQ